MTKIEWTNAPGFKGETWNPIVGCDIESAGCKNCYAMQQAHRIQAMNPNSHYKGTTKLVKGKAVWTGKISQASEKTLTAPMRWTKPRMVFVNSMGDLFHPNVPDEWIDRVFAVMALAPQHIFQILTKHPKRMREYLNLSFDNREHSIGAAMRLMVNNAGLPELPLPNVWLGVSAENQAMANLRIPELLQTPAAIRFVSYEPALGPVDFTSFIRQHAPWDISAVPEKWCDFIRPEWMPPHIFDEIKSFWCEEWGRGPRAWVGNMVENCAPMSGLTQEVDLIANGPLVRGLFIHSWNNIGRVRLNNGVWKPCCFFPKQYPKIHQIIAGGESGKNARTADVKWFRQVAKDCADSGTAFFMKQMGKKYLDGFVPVYSIKRHPKGADPSEWPEDLRIRQWPEVMK